MYLTADLLLEIMSNLFFLAFSTQIKGKVKSNNLSDILEANRRWFLFINLADGKNNVKNERIILVKYFALHF